MVQTLTIKCVRGLHLNEPFERTVEAPNDMTLGELHTLIQALAGFDDDHLFAFFTGRSCHGRREELVHGDDAEEAMDLLCEMRVSKVFPLPKGKKLFYWFDFGDDWMFQVTRRASAKKEEQEVDYPRVIKEVGPRPEQYGPMDE